MGDQSWTAYECPDGHIRLYTNEWLARHYTGDITCAHGPLGGPYEHVPMEPVTLVRAVLLEERDRTIEDLEERLFEYRLAAGAESELADENMATAKSLRSQLTEARAALDKIAHDVWGNSAYQQDVAREALEAGLVVAPQDKDR